MKPLEVGDPAPEVQLPIVGGGTFSLAEQRGSAVVLIFLRYVG